MNKDASIDLNERLGNNNGVFEFNETGGFFDTADEVNLSGPTLHALLENEDGEMVEASIDLNEFITNNEGELEWIY